MAGDWIKFDVTTPDKPEVVAIAADLGIDQDAVVGKLLRIWIWADQNSVAGNGLSVTSAFLDRLAFCPGFAGAMRKIGWLAGDDGALSFPNFERHNGKTAKNRAVSNRRVAEHRSARNGDVTPDVTPGALQKSLPEKRREEKEEKPPIPPASGGEADGVKPSRAKGRSEAMTYGQFVDACKADGEKLIPSDHAVFGFAATAGIPVEYLELAWREFARQYRGSKKTQAGKRGWRQKFENCVRRNWYRLWWFPAEGSCDLTTAGVALKREKEAHAA
ncbi:hypothetical protein [Coralloluteibacterium thermophilus]|uniref:Replication protein n=1 Tax=Coralloluteibacterium thermophilum TaxID=2707049 RepID=A0ABV9NIL6_9GAMM